MLNIISDIAGQYDTLLALVAKMSRCPIVLVGDLIDRGPRSYDVLKWAMKTPNVHTVLGNHELMMLQWLDGNDKWGDWCNNGGERTIDSFPRDEDGDPIISREVIDWVRKLPLFHLEDGLVVSHAPLSHEGIKKADNPEFFTWNRIIPQRQVRYSVFGHNSMWGLRTFSDEHGDYATCIDTSAYGILTGLHWPSREIYQQPYLKVTE